MQFLVIAYDEPDEKALERRMAVRADHIALIDRMRDAKKILYGAAILNDAEKMIGSVLVCDFDSRQELDEWLKIEPYVTERVWQNIEVKRCQVGPSFIDLGK
jgi:uncharacterized protein YciI